MVRNHCSISIFVEVSLLKSVTEDCTSSISANIELASDNESPLSVSNP